MWKRIFAVWALIGGWGCSGASTPAVVAPAAPEPVGEMLAALRDVRPWMRLDAVSALRRELGQSRPRAGTTAALEARVLDEATQSYARYRDVFVLQLIAELRCPDSWRLMLRALGSDSASEAALDWFEHTDVPAAHRPAVIRRIIELSVFDESANWEQGCERVRRVMRALSCVSGVRARDALVQVILGNQHHSVVRRAAIVALGRRAEPESLQVLVDATIMNGSNVAAPLPVETSWAVAHALRAYGPRSFPLLLDVWRGRNPTTLARARERFEAVSTERFDDSVGDALAVPCIRVLASLGDPRALDPILVAVESENRRVEIEAARAVALLGHVDRDRSWRAVAELVHQRYHEEGPLMDIDHDPLVRVIAGLAHPDSIPFLLERASALVDFKHLVDLALLDCLAFLNEGELPLLFAWLERHDGLPELPRVFQSIEDVLPMMRRCGENPDCYLEHALELMDPSDGEPEFFGRREEFQLRKALVMLRRFGAERHADALLPLIGTRFGRAEFLRTLERLGGDTVIALLGEQDDEELLRLHHRMALRRSILGQ